MMVELAYAQDIIIDPNGNVGFNPSLQRTAGPQVVDIARPNSGGVSHNQYTRFDVSPSGVVLNNARGAVNTAVAGMVAGNANLAAGTATTIVNEVKSTAGSRLLGPVEVAGDRANVIIANPSGIMCSGCTFLNTREATLSSGTPLINGGNVRLDVTTGAVTIGRGGLNGSGVSQVNLIGRMVVIDGKVTAIDGINVQGGAQSYDLTNKRRIGTLPGAGAQPVLTIDGTEFGAMHAGRIQIVGTENGLGVRAFGALQGSTGGVTVQNAGDILLRSAAAATRTEVRSTEGRLTIERDVTSATADVVLHGQNGIAIGARAGLFGSTGVSATGGALSFEGVLQSSRNVSLTASRDMTFAAYGTSGAAFSVSANSGLSFTKATIVAPTLVANSGTAAFRLADSALFVGESVTANAGDFHLGQEVVIQSLTANAVAKIAVNATGSFYNAADIRAFDAATFTYAGNLYNAATGVIADEKIAYRATSTIENAGALLGGETLTLTVTALTNTATGIISADRGSIAVSRSLENNGRILSDGTLTLRAGETIRNTGILQGMNLALIAPNITTTGTSEVRGRVAATLTATNGTIQTNGILSSQGTLTVVAGSFSNAGWLASASTLAVTATTITNQGAVNSGSAINLVATGVIRNEGDISSFGTLLLNSATGVDNTANLVANTTLTVRGPQFRNIGADAFVQARRADLQSAIINNAGRVFMVNSFSRAGDIDRFVNTGVFASEGDITLRGRNTASQFEQGETGVMLSGLSSADRAADLIAERSVALNFARMTLAGDIQAGGTINLTQPGSLEIAGALSAGKHIIVAADNVVIGTKAALRAIGYGQFTAPGTVTNAGTLAFGDVIYTRGNLTSFINSGVIYARVSSLEAMTGIFANSGIIQTAAGLSVTAQTISNTGLLQTGDSLALLARRAMGTNPDGTIRYQLGALINDGTLTVAANLTLIGGTVATGADGYIAAARMGVTADTFVNRANAMIEGTASNLWTVANSFAQFGSLYSKASLVVDANTATLDAAAMLASGDALTIRTRANSFLLGTLAAKNIQVTASHISTGAATSIVANDDLRLIATSGLVLSLGELAAGDDLVIAGQTFDLRGKAYAPKVTVTGTTAGVTRGTLYAADDAKITVTDGTFRNIGTIEARAKLEIAADNVTLDAGGRLAATDVTVMGDAAVTNAGEILGAQSTLVTAGTLFTNAATGKLTGVSTAVRADDFTNAGAIDVYGFYGTIADLTTNTGSIKTRVYTGIASVRLQNVAGASIISDDHLHLNTSGQTSNFQGAQLRGVTVDLRGGTVSNQGNLQATRVLNLSDTSGSVSNAMTGTIYGDEIYLAASTGFDNSGLIGTTSSKTVAIDAGTSITNAGRIFARDISLDAATSIANSGGIYASGTAQLAAGTSISQTGIIRSANLRLSTIGTIVNDGDARATAEALIDGGSIQNRVVALTPGVIQANKLVLLSRNTIINQGSLTGLADLGLQADFGSIHSSPTGTLSGNQIDLIAKTGWVMLDHAIMAGNTLNLEGIGINILATASAVNSVTLKATQLDVNVYSAVTAKQVSAEAARNINANAFVFRGNELTQLLANDIGRLTASELSPTSLASTSTTAAFTSFTGINKSVQGRELQYIASYGDLIDAYGTNSWLGLNHYTHWGANEGRQVLFDGLAYIASYGELINAYGANGESGAFHYILWGRNAQLRIWFNAEQYLRNYADLRAAFGSDLEAATSHYIQHGYREGRTWSEIAGAMSMADWAVFAGRNNGANWQAAQTIAVTTYTATSTFFNTTDSKLEVVGGPLKDLHIELRTGSFGTQGDDLPTALVTQSMITQKAMWHLGFLGSNLNAAANSTTISTATLAGGSSVWHTYERAGIIASGNVSLIARSGDMMLTGTIWAGGNIYLHAGDRLGLQNANLSAAKLLELKGVGNVLRYGGVTLTPGDALKVSTYASMFTSTWLGSKVLDYDVSLSAYDLVVDSSYQNHAHSTTFEAVRDIIQTNEIVVANRIDYRAGRDLNIDFNPFEWRAENPAALYVGTGWDTENLGRFGYTVVAGAGGMSLFAGQDVRLTSGKLYSSREMTITAERNILSEPLYVENNLYNRPGDVSWGFSGHYQGLWPDHSASNVNLYELRAYENQIFAVGDIALTAAGSVNLIGTYLETYAGNIRVQARHGGVTMIAAPGQWIYEYENVRSWRSGFLRLVHNTEVTQYDALKDLYKPTILNATAGTILVQSTGANGAYASILTAGTVFNARNISLATPNGNIIAGTYRQRDESVLQVNHSKRLLGWIGWGGSNTTNVRHNLTNYGNNFLADQILSLSAPTGTLGITGGTLWARQINITAATLEINAAINSQRTEYNARRDNMITITTITSGRSRETADLPQITSILPINFTIGGGAHIRAAARGTDLNSQLVNVIGTRQFENTTLNLAAPSTLTAAASAGASVDRRYLFDYKLPGASDAAQFAYLDTLTKDFGATYHSFALRDQQWYDKQVQLNPAFKALLTAVVSYATAGLGATLAPTGSLTAGTITAASNSLIVGVVEGTITGNFNIGDILRGAILSGVSSHIAGYLTQKINIGGYTDHRPRINTLDDLIKPAAIVDRLGDRVITSVVSSVVHGQDPAAGLGNLGRSFLVSEVMAIAQFGIGELGTNRVGGHTAWEGSAAHLLLHGGVGCLAMAALQGTCTSGFFAGAGQSLLAGSNLTNAQKLQLAPLVGSLLGYIGSNGNAINVTFGGTIAQSGIVNNYLTHDQIVGLQADLSKCRSDDFKCRELVFKTYGGYSEANREALRACQTQDCWDFHAKRIQKAQPARLALYEAAYNGPNGPDPFLIQTNNFVYDEQSLSGFSMLVVPGAVAAFAAWGANNCRVLDNACRSDFATSQTLDTLRDMAALGIEFLPGIGDIIGVLDCAGQPSMAICLGAVAGLIPVFGDAGRLVLRYGDDLYQLSENGSAYRLLNDGINANRPDLPDGHHWAADSYGNTGIITPDGTFVVDSAGIDRIVLGLNSGLPSVYTRNTDGSYTGPGGGRSWNTGEIDANGNPILRRDVGGYFAVNQDGTQTPTRSPYESTTQLHHVCTNKNCVGTSNGGPWTPKFQEIFDNAGLNINGEINKIQVPGHLGPHPAEYHVYVFDRLQLATAGLQPYTPAYTNAVQNMMNVIKRQAITPGHQVNSWLIGK